LANDLQMQKDRARLLSICAAQQKFVQLQGAPRPTSVLEAVTNEPKTTKKRSAVAAR
jgi:hypothetical protein